MRVSDDRYARDRQKLDLAVRLIRHEARTHTIRQWTGLSDDRIRKLYRSYVSSGGTQKDATSVGLIFAKAPPRQIAKRIDLHNNLFLIPAGARDQEVTECHTFNKEMWITSLTPHMHYRGKAMTISAKYPDGRKQILLDVPDYNFNWQITYRPVEPLHLPKGTRIEIDAHFDNSANNPLNPDPAKTVRWGSESSTEMMDGWIEYVDASNAESR